MKTHHIFIGFFSSVAAVMILAVGMFVRAYEPAIATKLINTGAPRVLTVGWDESGKKYELMPLAVGAVKPIPVTADPAYAFYLSNGNLVMKNQEATVWQSPADWWVSSYALADVNHDGKLELNISLWKAGDFGPSKPVWLKENDMSVKNHLFVYELTADGVNALWQSSNLDQPSCEFVFADFDGDNQQELGVIEGEYTTTRACRGKFMAIWKWDEWGFYNQWRSKEGHFSDLRAVASDGAKYLQANIIMN